MRSCVEMSIEFNKYNFQMNKIVGYSGFRTYSELPYPTQKQGKELERENKVWSSTVRQADYVAPLENYQNNKTVYTKSYLQNTFPKHYHPEHVPKGGARTIKFGDASSIKAYDKQEALKYSQSNQKMNEGGDPRKTQMLKTGCQHWQSIYQQMNATAGQLKGRDSSMGAQGNSRSGTHQGANNQQVSANSGSNGERMGGTGFEYNVRGASLGGCQSKTAQQTSRAKSYKNRPYINNSKLGTTEYKFNYGQRIGCSPLDLMNRVSLKQPLRDNPLKRGTNQLWTQIPNYQGFKPSELSFKQLQQKINNRSKVNKGSLKLQTTENFLVQSPGYGGHKPQFQSNASNLRSSCLGNNDFS